MNAVSLAWDPLFPATILAALAAASALILALGLFRRAGGLAWRGLAATAILIALANPALIVERREPLSDIAVVVVDETASQAIGDRPARTQAALKAIEAQLGDRDDIELRVVRVGPGDGAAPAAGLARSGPVDGTHLFAALERALADIPRRRLAGVMMITDGQVHDAPNAESLNLQAPLHALITGDRAAGDRKLTVIEAPNFGIVGEQVQATIRVDDPANAGVRQARLQLRRDGETQTRTVLVDIGTDYRLDLPIDHGGTSVFELTVEPGPQELTAVNNSTVIVVNGVRDRLRVLLVSGQPHPGERTWRNLLKADPSVDLVHFTILRPPEKQDGTPVRELSLIAFPIRELFETKLNDFDLIIFDNYERRGVLPQFYLANIADYVKAGGALLEAVGPGFASPLSLYRTPLAEVLPGAPTGNIVEEGFRARVTDAGYRHPVTSALPGAGTPGGNEPPDWGRWFRQIEVDALSGTVLMEGTRERPLLILDRVGEGRVAQLLSDQIWLWARGYEGGGPHAELLRRLAHWLMKEPELEEDRLVAELQGDRLAIVRRSLEPDDSPVQVVFPSGRVESVQLEEAGGGQSTGFIQVDEAGLYRLDDGTRTALTAVGALNPLEFQTVAATDTILAPISAATGGGVVWLADSATPDLRRIGRGRDMAGTAAGGTRPWLGLQRNGDFIVRGIAEVPILPALLILLFAMASLLLAWRREGR